MTAGIQAASIGIPDTFFILMLALVVFGPRRLPEIGRQIGKLMYEFRKASNEFKYQMEEELRKSEEAERRQKLDEENRKLYPQLGPPAEPAVALSGPVNESRSSGGAAEGEVAAGLKILPPSTGETVATSGKSTAEIAREAAEEEERLSRAGRLSETLVAEGAVVEPVEAVEIVSSKRAPRDAGVVGNG